MLDLSRGEAVARLHQETEFPQAKDVAEDWYWTLRERFAAGKIKPLRRFRDVAATFVHEYEI